MRSRRLLSVDLQEWAQRFGATHGETEDLRPLLAELGSGGPTGRVADQNGPFAGALSGEAILRPLHLGPQAQGMAVHTRLSASDGDRFYQQNRILVLRTVGPNQYCPVGEFASPVQEESYCAVEEGAVLRMASLALVSPERDALQVEFCTVMVVPTMTVPPQVSRVKSSCQPTPPMLGMPSPKQAPSKEEVCLTTRSAEGASASKRRRLCRSESRGRW